ncbi:MAG TPA: PLP-dependent aminotransferase family protein [Hyphomicrobiaceae bacterium]|nr:PLP-dependent aminotransferase family protein [Hyphomicrobiaceae bacterium]
MTQYASLVDEIAAEIASGSLKPGDRLPPQRTFAYKRGIAPSTAGRVYSELLRRGLVVGEVGRGTFVAGQARDSGPARGEPHEGRIDLEFNFPTIPQQATLIAKSLAGLQRVDVIGAAIGPVTTQRVNSARATVAAHLRTADWQPQPDAFVFTGAGRQSIAAAISALVPVGGRLAVEALSYPMVKSIAARLGASIVPIAMDSDGLRPDALAKAHRNAKLSAVYLQPVMHNPLGQSMSDARRSDILRTASKLDLPIIEDLVYGFLSDKPPLAAEQPDRCIMVDSLSKIIAPGAAVGMLYCPNAIRDRLSATVRAGAWTVSPLSLEAGMRILTDGTAAEIRRLKRLDARRRQAIMAKALTGFEIAADPGSYHLWLRLPETWRSDAFAAAAARSGVAVTPSSAFAMAPGHAPNAVRLALGLPSHDELRLAGKRLADLLKARPEDADNTE